jgi:hypothetical protein
VYYIDLRKELAAILKEFGRKVAVLHCDRRIRCPECWDATYDEPLSDCPKCLGTGYLWTVKVHRSWSSPPSELTLPPEPKFVPYQSDTTYFFFEYNTIVDNGDYILDLERYDVMAVYRVTKRPIFYGLGGRREFIRVSTVQRPEELARMRKWWREAARLV